MRATTRGWIGSGVVVCTLASAAASAGVEPTPWRPASLVTNNLVMQGGRPFVFLADLARALGGTGRYDPVRLRYEIQPGAGGVLLADPAALGALARIPASPSLPVPAGRRPVTLSVAGAEVTVGSPEIAMLRPAEPAVSLGFLARLLGGEERFDAGKGIWLLPAGGPMTPLRFR